LANADPESRHAPASSAIEKRIISIPVAPAALLASSLVPVAPSALLACSLVPVAPAALLASC
jgi:hypothetical protein